MAKCSPGKAVPLSQSFECATQEQPYDKTHVPNKHEGKSSRRAPPLFPSLFFIFLKELCNQIEVLENYLSLSCYSTLTREDLQGGDPLKPNLLRTRRFFRATGLESEIRVEDRHKSA